MKKWPFDSKPVPIERAIKFISRVAYPDDDELAAKKRVRERIRYATHEGVIDASITMGAAAWEWALVQKGWEALVTVPGFPYKRLAEAKAEGKFRRLRPSGTSGTLYGTPSDPAELLAEFHKANARINELLIENAELNKRNEALNDELCDANLKISKLLTSKAERTNKLSEKAKDWSGKAQS